MSILAVKGDVVPHSAGGGFQFGLDRSATNSRSRPSNQPRDGRLRDDVERRTLADMARPAIPCADAMVGKLVGYSKVPPTIRRSLLGGQGRVKPVESAL